MKIKEFFMKLLSLNNGEKEFNKQTEKIIKINKKLKGYKNFYKKIDLYMTELELKMKGN